MHRSSRLRGLNIHHRPVLSSFLSCRHCTVMAGDQGATGASAGPAETKPKDDTMREIKILMLHGEKLIPWEIRCYHPQLLRILCMRGNLQTSLMRPATFTEACLGAAPVSLVGLDSKDLVRDIIEDPLVNTSLQGTPNPGHSSAPKRAPWKSSSPNPSRPRRSSQRSSTPPRPRASVPGTSQGINRPAARRPAAAAPTRRWTRGRGSARTRPAATTAC